MRIPSPPRVLALICAISLAIGTGGAAHADGLPPLQLPLILREAFAPTVSPTATPSPTAPDPTPTPSPSHTSTPTPTPCITWVQVNDDAFGLDGPSGQYPRYFGEDAFEVAVYNGQLYLGMEADNTLGARLWRTRRGVIAPLSQADWELVVGDAFGSPYNDHIDSLLGFRGYLYATTADWARLTAEVWRSASGDAGTWEEVNQGRWTSYPNLNANLRDLVTLDVNGASWLCGGTSNEDVGAQVWCTQDGRNWSQKNHDGFGAPGNVMIASSEVHGDALYVAVRGTGPDGGALGGIWRTRGELDPVSADRWEWERVLSDEGPHATLAASYAGQLYAATRDDAGLALWRSVSGDPGTWEHIETPGLTIPANRGIDADGAAIYDGALYIAVANVETGAQIWRSIDGAAWTPVELAGFGDRHTTDAQLVTFNGQLYAWATNYYTGQKVYRADR